MHSRLLPLGRIAAPTLWALGLGYVAPKSSPAMTVLNDTIPRLTAPPAMETRLYVGMWTSHLDDLGRGMKPNSLLGIAYRGFYGATFINSFGDRAMTAGVQRTLTPGDSESSPAAALGYRAGVVTGYDERFLTIAGKIPVLPFAQLVGMVQHRRLAIELAYSGVVVSLLLSGRL